MTKSVIVTMTLFLFVAVLSAGNVHAMSAYARTFSMKCGDCHKQRIPELNDFGIAFYKNGFVLPGENQKATKPENEASTAGTATPPSTKAPKSGEDGEDSAEDEEENDPTEKKPEPPPLVVYRWESSDGSIHFTDDPLLRERLREKKPRIEAVRSVKIQRKHKKRQDASPEESSPPYRTYQECMERQLESATQGSAQEAMELFTRAERICGDLKQRRK